MAEFDPAYNYMICNEVIGYGTPNAVYYSNHPSDPGGETAWGITIATARKALYNAPMKAMREDEAKTIYFRNYWKFGGVTDQRVASKLFDMAVNMGVSRAIRIVQGIVFKGGAGVDGAWGPNTEGAVNHANPDELLPALADACAEFYNGIVRAKPDQSVFLKGWLRRAKKIPS
jgi:lysozyme family protein